MQWWPLPSHWEGPLFSKCKWTDVRRRPRRLSVTEKNARLINRHHHSHRTILYLESDTESEFEDAEGEVNDGPDRPPERSDPEDHPKTEPKRQRHDGRSGR